MKAEYISHQGDGVLKVCQGCLLPLPTSSFPMRDDRSGRLRPYCRECTKDNQRKRYEHHKRTKPFLHRCSRARSRSQHLKVPFDLTPEYLESIWTGFCPVSGVSLNLNTDRLDECAAELDRFLPDKGYIKGNVCWLSRKINRLKNNASVEELENLLNWMKGIVNES